MKKNLFLLFALVASTTLSQAAIVEGTCGDNLTWSLNTKDSTLTIEGSGDMYSYYKTSTPWSQYSSYIAYVKLHEGITSIGDKAFTGGVFSSIEIPNSVTKIGIEAFWWSNLRKIKIGTGLKKIDRAAFTGCKIIFVYISDIEAWCGIDFYESYSNPMSCTFAELYLNDQLVQDLIIPNTVTSIGKYAFWKCDRLTSLEIPNSVIEIGSLAFGACDRLETFRCKMLTPPTWGVSTGIKAGNCTLYVPAVSTETYKNTIWWEDFKEILPLPVSTPVVTFIDWDGTILSIEEVEEGTAATTPSNPTREGYTFIGWDKDFSNVIEDMIITAQYKINRYKVDFVDWDETVLKSDSVDWNTAAIAPENPYRKGYEFIGWDKDFSNVKEDLVVTAQYEFGEKAEFEVQFLDQDSAAILSQSVTFKVPAAPEIEGFTFIGWQIVSTMLDSKLIEIQAVYELDEPSAAPEVVTNPSNPAQKLIRNGSVYILTDDSRTYTLTGQQVK